LKKEGIRILETWLGIKWRLVAKNEGCGRRRGTRKIGDGDYEVRRVWECNKK